MGQDGTGEVIERLAGMASNDFIYTVDQASKRRDERLERFVADAVAKDIQANMEVNGYVPVCPGCGKKANKNGRRGAVQRYRCPWCGKSFSATGGTILEKTRYTWDAWVDVAYGLLNGHSLRDIQQGLADDRKCEGITLNTVWGMRLKIMDAVRGLPAPKLSGVVQIDDLSVREDQKGSRSLEDPLPAGISPGREPRYGRFHPSQLGVRGSEYATITCMVDQSGRCAVAFLGMGTVPQEATRAFVESRTEAVAFACSDADPAYAAVFKEMNVPHYVRPSDYLDTLKKRGYEQPSKADKGLAARQRKKNRRVAERVWEDGEGERIENRGRMTYKEFEALKRENGLNISRVNELHKDLRKFIEKDTGGVATRWLDAYCGWFEWRRNREAEAGRRLASRRDAEAVLMEAVKAGRSLGAAEIAGIRESPALRAKPSGKYLHQLDAGTRAVREMTGDPAFRFGGEDAVGSFDVRRMLDSLSDRQLRGLGRATGLHDWKRRNRTTLILGLAKQDDIRETLLATIVAVKTRRIEEVDARADEWRERHPRNRKVLKGSFPPRLFCGPEDAAEPVVFLDCETTGLSKARDEVLSVGIVSSEGEVLHEGMYRPLHRRSWAKAEAVNGIGPADVAGCGRLLDDAGRIAEVLRGAGCVAGWNVRFDAEMLYAGGVDVPVGDGAWCDLMDEFARKWNSVGGRSGVGRKVALEEAVGLLGLDGDGTWKRHTAVGDAGMLAGIWEWIWEGE